MILWELILHSTLKSGTRRTGFGSISSRHLKRKRISINHIGTPTATSAGIITFPISLMRQQAISGVAPRTESAKKSQSTLKTTNAIVCFDVFLIDIRCRVV